MRSAADGDGRDAPEVGARVVTELGVHDPAVRRAPTAPPSALSASALTGAVVKQQSTLELVTTPTSCVRPARAVLVPSVRCWFRLCGVGAGVGVDAVVDAGVGSSCAAASRAVADRAEYDSQRCKVR